MGRHRSPRWRHLPPNLYGIFKGERLHYRYKHPHTGKYHYFGTDRTTAFRAAQTLNEKLLNTPTIENLVAKVLSNVEPVKYRTYAETYCNETLPNIRNRRGQGLSAATLSEYTRYIRQSIDAWGDRSLASITRRDVAEWLDRMTANSRNHARSTVRQLFARAIADGHLDLNPVEGTLKATVTVQRQRLTEAQCAQIRAKAEPWLQLAIDLALETLQRREDLVRLTRDDLIDGYLYVRQKKTGVNVRMPLSPELLARLPTTGPLLQRNDAAVTKDYLSRAFAAARDSIPELTSIPPSHRPSFHELRALGALLMERQGINPQARLGHLEAKTTRLYLDRHKERWIEG
jgi:enterobacteria phage integrase